MQGVAAQAEIGNKGPQHWDATRWEGPRQVLVQSSLAPAIGRALKKCEPGGGPWAQVGLLLARELRAFGTISV